LKIADYLASHDPTVRINRRREVELDDVFREQTVGVDEEEPVA